MKILGIDYGRKKIGIAVGDTVLKLAEPLQVLASSKFPERISSKFNGTGAVQISKLIKENAIEKIVIGVPGGKMDEEIKKFGEELKKETDLPVEYFDETLSTQDAQRVLIESGGSRKKRKEKEDAVAAAIMLQWYLEGGNNV